VVYAPDAFSFLFWVSVPSVIFKAVDPAFRADLEHERIYDRIMKRCIPVAFSDRNYRTDKDRTNMENASGILRE